MTQQCNRMSQKKFRIGELADQLRIKKFVIRFWEKEFGLKATRSTGGQRFYTNEDYKCFIAIKDLLYNQGYTIAGAKTKLSKEVKKIKDPEKILGAKLIDPAFAKASASREERKKASSKVVDEKFLEKVKNLKSHLIKFKQTLV